MINGHSPFYPDRNHIHHKLLNRGINERSTSIILYSISLFFGIIALSIFGMDGKVFFMHPPPPTGLLWVLLTLKRMEHAHY